MKKNNILVVIIVILSVLLASSIAFTVYLSVNEKVESENIITTEEKDAAVKNIIERFDSPSSSSFDSFFRTWACYSGRDFLSYEELTAEDYAIGVSYFIKNSSYFTYDKCPASVESELIHQQEQAGIAVDCEELLFIKAEDVEKAKNENFGEATLLKVKETFDLFYLEKSNLYYIYTCDTCMYHSFELYDSKMPKKDTVELYYNLLDGETSEEMGKVKYTFKKEKSNWVLHSSKKIK